MMVNDITQGRPSTQPDMLEVLVGKILTERQLTISAAESCTGGLLMHRLTNVPGSSIYVMGGFVTYSNDAKIKFARVSSATLTQYGAVSEQTVAEMARGTREAFGTSIALSITGITGPGGGTPEKPVGLVYIGLSTTDILRVQRFLWTSDREGNKAYSATAALQMLYDYLKLD